MNISYDIFDLADFPIILTDRDFIIVYKNNLAAKFFGKLRKRSKIIKHFRNFKNDIDFSDINELDIETGTQFMRALVFPLEEEHFIFMFFTLYAFYDTNKILEYVRKHHAGNLLDFYFAAYREHKTLENASAFEKANVPERAYSELMHLLSYYADKPEFMRSEVYEISEMLSQISAKAASHLSIFGLSTYYRKETSTPCFSKINLKIFTFSLYRIIYTAFKLSSTGKLQISIDDSNMSFADICICTETALPREFANANVFSSLVDLLPEFSFEFKILEKIGYLNDIIDFSVQNSVLKLRYRIKCETGFNLVVRSEPPELRKKRINKIISEAICKIKPLLSKK